MSGHSSFFRENSTDDGTQGCILFPRFLYPSLFSLQVKLCVFCNFGGVNNYGTFLLQICFIMFQKFPKIPHKNPMFLQICHIFLISFPVLSKVVLVLADVYRPKRNYIHPWVGGWSEDWRVMLNSTQDQVEVEVKDRVELGNNTHQPEKVF